MCFVTICLYDVLPLLANRQNIPVNRLVTEQYFLYREIFMFSSVSYRLLLSRSLSNCDETETAFVWRITLALLHKCIVFNFLTLLKSFCTMNTKLFDVQTDKGSSEIKEETIMSKYDKGSTW